MTIATGIGGGGLLAADVTEPRGFVASIHARINVGIQARVQARIQAGVAYATMPVAALAVSDASAEETAKEAFVRQRFPWYDSQSDSLRRVTVRDQQARDENRKSRWDIDGKPEEKAPKPNSNNSSPT